MPRGCGHWLRATSKAPYQSARAWGRPRPVPSLSREQMQKAPCTHSWPRWISRGAPRAGQAPQEASGLESLKGHQHWSASVCHHAVHTGHIPCQGATATGKLGAHVLEPASLGLSQRPLCDVRKFREVPEPQSSLLSNGADDSTHLTRAGAQLYGTSRCLGISATGGTRGLKQPALSSPCRATDPVPPGPSMGHVQGF